MSKKVYVGMSGGVDSSVAAAMLKQQGYEVTGVFMKNWTQDLPGHYCSWQEDFQDAKRVAVQLDIDFKVYDFEQKYRQKVVNYMVNEYKMGHTPNPDIVCNQEIKFKLFLQTALKDGADLIATGHYARIKNGNLYMGIDPNKDQSYFLYRVSREALTKTLMPIGEFTKPQIRAIAKKMNLSTATKKDSQGICFIGTVGIKDFLMHELGPQPYGKIINQDGTVVGEHDGAIFYTLGQRHGLNIGGGLPYYVSGKNIKKNELFVTTNLSDKNLWNDSVDMTDCHWIAEPPNNSKKFTIKTRYRAPLIEIVDLKKSQDNWHFKLKDEVRAITPGQSAVVYSKDQVIGGGVVI